MASIAELHLVSEDVTGVMKPTGPNPPDAAGEARQLTEIVRAVSGARELRDILPEVCRRAARLCGADHATIFVWGDDPTKVYPARSEPPLVEDGGDEGDDEFWQRLQEFGCHRLEELRLIRHLASSRRSVHIDDARGSALVNQDSVQAFGLRTLYGVPLIAGDQVAGEQVIGALLFDRLRVDPFDERQQELGSVAAELVALVLHKALMQEKLVRSEKLRAMAEMAGGVAHDFNNLLTAILGRTQFLLRELDLDRLSPGECRRSLAIVEEAARLGADTVRRLVQATGAEARPDLVEEASEEGETLRRTREILAATQPSVPMAASSGPRPAQVPESLWQAGSRILRVLVVDDEDSVREVLGQILLTGGHEVWQAGSGIEGLRFLESQRVDLVLTDLGMPGMTGWEVAAHVKGRWPEVKVGVISGWSSQMESNDLAARGVDFYCSKPIEMDALLATLATL